MSTPSCETVRKIFVLLDEIDTKCTWLKWAKSEQEKLKNETMSEKINAVIQEIEDLRAELNDALPLLSKPKHARGWDV